MIYATIISNDDGYTGFNVIGHAGAGTKGNDLVCCAVSVLVENTINALESIAGIKPRLVQNEEEGLMDVSFDKPLAGDAKVIMDVLKVGLESLSKQYKSYLSLKFRRC